MTSPTRSPSSTGSLHHPALDATIQAVNLDAILDTVRDKLCATTARWGEQKAGGFSLVRFLHLDDDQVVVRLPLYPDPEDVGPTTPEITRSNVRRMASMVASMEYVATHSSIPVPRIMHACLDPELGGVHSPYVVMSKVEGTPLSCFWDDMADTQRDIVLEQVVDILLELSTLRFPKIGCLFKTPDGGWCFDSSFVDGGAPEETYTSGSGEFMAIANARLRKIQHDQFGRRGNPFEFAHYWLMRSLIPALYDNSLDAKGFPLMHGDFHSQNIFVADVNTHPRITGIIDWDDSGTVSVSSFAQYPLFIVDHPAWPEDHPLRPRNIRDQASFNCLLEKAERKKFPDTAPALSRMFANSRGVYIFEQCIRFELMYSLLFGDLVRYLFGPTAEEEFLYDYTDALERGILKDVMSELSEEASVADEAKDVLGDDVDLKGLSKKDFIEVVGKHKDRFSTGGKVLSWLNRVAEGESDC